MMDEKLIRLRDSLQASNVVSKNGYTYFVHSLTDGVPSLEPSLLQDVSDLISPNINHDCIDKLIGIEAMGLPLLTALSLSTGLPMSIVRKRGYGLEGEIEINQITGYGNSKLYINDITAGDRVFVVDDVLSTGGTLDAVLAGLSRAGAIVEDVYVIVEKGNLRSQLELKHQVKISSLVSIEIDGDSVSVTDKR